MRLKLILTGIVCWVLVALPGVATAQLVIDVDPSDFRKYPIAAAGLKHFAEGEASEAASKAAADLSAEGQQILMNDLAIAGIFDVLNPKSFLEDPAKAGITPAQIDFTKWLQVGADYLVKGGMWLDGEKLKLDMRLFDVTTGAEKLQRTYEGEKTSFRMFLHAFASDLMEIFTREKGAFTSRIVAVRHAGQSRQIYVMDFDGHGGHAVLDNSTINLLPTWGPAGQWIYFTSYMNNNPDLYRMQPHKGGKIVKVSAYRGLNVGASVSPDGTKVALTLSKDGNSEIYVMDVEGRNQKRITRSNAIDSSPSWAPDSRWLTFVSDRHGYPQIYKVDTMGGDPIRLTYQGNYNQSPAWSPKGDKIVFCGRDERLVFDLFYINPMESGARVQRLTQDRGNNEDPAFSPDGRHIVFTSTRTGSKQLWIMNADGSNQHQITNGPGSFSTPDWSPRNEVESK